MTQSFINLPESKIIDNSRLRFAQEDIVEDVENTVVNFIQKRELVAPFLNESRIHQVDSFNLNVLFDEAIKLAGGRESNFVYNEYKVFLVQFSYQLGFLFKKLFPENPMGNIIMMKMNQLSTRELKWETKLLDSIVKEHFNDKGIYILDTEESDEVYLWNTESLSHFMVNLLEVGEAFKKTVELRMR